MENTLEFCNIIFDRYKVFLSTSLKTLTNLSKSGKGWQDGERLRFVSKLEEFETKNGICFKNEIKGWSDGESKVLQGNRV